MDIERREFISGSTAAVMTGLAGCSRLSSDPATITITDVTHVTGAQPDDEIDVSVRVENTGDESGTDTVVLRFADSVIDARDVTLDSEVSQSLPFTIPATDTDPGTHSVEVSTSEESYTSDLHIDDPEPASLEITNIDIPSTTAYDDPLDVTVTVRNTGGLTAEQNITLQATDDTIAANTVAVTAGDETTSEFTVPADEYFSGEYTLTISTDDDERTETVQVDNPNPYGKDTLVVALEQRTPARHDMQGIVTDAISYWEENAEQYAGYPITYEYRPNATDPDVEIIVVEQIQECGEHSGDEIVGCAPYVTDHAPETATIRIVDGYRKEWMTTTLKHEFGHTLGLDHQSEPLHIMSDDIEDRIPDYEQRQTALTAYENTFDPLSNGNDAWSAATTAWSNAAYERTERKAREAADLLLDAQQYAREAKNIASTLGEDTAYELLDRTEQKIEALRLAAENGVRMAQEAQQTFGDPEPYREASNEYIDEYNQYSFPESRDVTHAFGFPARR